MEYPYDSLFWESLGAELFQSPTQIGLVGRWGKVRDREKREIER
jgi:hypothetical protein